MVYLYNYPLTYTFNSPTHFSLSHSLCKTPALVKSDFLPTLALNPAAELAGNKDNLLMGLTLNSGPQISGGALNAVGQHAALPSSICSPTLPGYSLIPCPYSSPPSTFSPSSLLAGDLASYFTKRKQSQKDSYRLASIHRYRYG